MYEIASKTSGTNQCQIHSGITDVCKGSLYTYSIRVFVDELDQELGKL